MGFIQSGLDTLTGGSGAIGEGNRARLLWQGRAGAKRSEARLDALEENQIMITKELGQVAGVAGAEQSGLGGLTPAEKIEMINPLNVGGITISQIFAGNSKKDIQFAKRTSERNTRYLEDFTKAAEEVAYNTKKIKEQDTKIKRDSDTWGKKIKDQYASIKTKLSKVAETPGMIANLISEVIAVMKVKLGLWLVGGLSMLAVGGSAAWAILRLLGVENKTMGEWISKTFNGFWKWVKGIDYKSLSSDFVGWIGKQWEHVKSITDYLYNTFWIDSGRRKRFEEFLDRSTKRPWTETVKEIAGEMLKTAWEAATWQAALVSKVVDVLAASWTPIYEQYIKPLVNATIREMLGKSETGRNMLKTYDQTVAKNKVNYDFQPFMKKMLELRKIQAEMETQRRKKDWSNEKKGKNTSTLSISYNKNTPLEIAARIAMVEEGLRYSKKHLDGSWGAIIYAWETGGAQLAAHSFWVKITNAGDWYDSINLWAQSAPEWLMNQYQLYLQQKGLNYKKTIAKDVKNVKMMLNKNKDKMIKAKDGNYSLSQEHYVRSIFVVLCAIQIAQTKKKPIEELNKKYLAMRAAFLETYGFDFIPGMWVSGVSGNEFSEQNYCKNSGRILSKYEVMGGTSLAKQEWYENFLNGKNVAGSTITDSIIDALIKKGVLTEKQGKLAKNAITDYGSNYVPVKGKSVTGVILTKGCTRVLDMIAYNESSKKPGEGYDVSYGFKQDQYFNKGVTNTTIGEVLRIQKSILADLGSSPVGRYQFIRSTLRSYAKKCGFGMDVLFDKNAQDKMAMRYLQDIALKKLKTGSITPEQAADRLAPIWASMPAASGHAKQAHNPIDIGEWKAALVECATGSATATETTTTTEATEATTTTAGDSTSPASPATTTSTENTDVDVNAACILGGKSLVNVNENIIKMMKKLCNLSKPMCHHPLYISSAYRSRKHNESVSGAGGSLHMQGRALDMHWPRYDQESKEKFLKLAVQAGFTGFGIYSKALHVDDGPKRGWGSSYKRDTLPKWAAQIIGTAGAGGDIGDSSITAEASDTASGGALSALGISAESIFGTAGMTGINGIMKEMEGAGFGSIDSMMSQPMFAGMKAYMDKNSAALLASTQKDLQLFGQALEHKDKKKKNTEKAKGIPTIIDENVDPK